mmetsp:Transcript_64769/g.107663  ORF Transcript_64769/g.107663 Transcript_64769/m.107663 type:complete len:233 (-) Transcript_64769:283-981(-)
MANVHAQVQKLQAISLILYNTLTALKKDLLPPSLGLDASEASNVLWLASECEHVRHPLAVLTPLLCINRRPRRERVQQSRKSRCCFQCHLSFITYFVCLGLLLPWGFRFSLKFPPFSTSQLANVGNSGIRIRSSQTLSSINCVEHVRIHWFLWSILVLFLLLLFGRLLLLCVKGGARARILLLWLFCVCLQPLLHCHCIIQVFNGLPRIVLGVIPAFPFYEELFLSLAPSRL